MNWKSIFPILILAAAISCKENHNGSAQWPYGVKYEIFVRAFADGDGDGKGDIKGLTGKLDYLQDLGINGLWLMPVMNSPSYHKYDVADYKSIDPEYGTIADFKKMVEEAHRRNIKIIIDLVINHTSSHHPWFESAVKDPRGPYRNYYVWAKRDSIRRQISAKKVKLVSDNITQWHAVEGDTTADQYYGFFSSHMPDLNWDNPKVKEEFIDIGKFWLSEVGIDGFRLDAARYIFPTERENDNEAFWIWFRTEMEKINPRVYLVGEVWTNTKDAAPYVKGLHSVFNCDLSNAISKVVKAGRDTIGFPAEYERINDIYLASSNQYLDAPFLKNHDQNRILSELENNIDRARVAAGILLTLPGAPYLYYGEEIGMKGTKPDEFIREPFIWDYGKKDPAQTSWETPRYSTDKTVVPLSAQMKDDHSLFNFYRELIHYRNSSAVLTEGILETLPSNVNEVIIYLRSLGDKKSLVLNNISDVEITIKMEEELAPFTEIDFDFGGKATLKNKEIIIPAYSTVIMK